MQPWLKIGHWALNAILWFATVTLLYFAFFGSGPNVDSTSRVGTFITSVCMGAIAYAFTQYTLKKG